MKRYIIERHIHGVHALDAKQRCAAAQTSNEALARLGGRAHWVQSYVVDDKTYCEYLADDEAAIREHARLSGFPATHISEVKGMLLPETANA